MADEAHILVVDDDARLRGLLSRYLADQGFRVTTAADAADARDKLRFVHPDLMVLDVMMPGEGGLAFTASLRNDLGNIVPVLLLTARGAPEDTAREIGAAWEIKLRCDTRRVEQPRRRAPADRRGCST